MVSVNQVRNLFVADELVNSTPAVKGKLQVVNVKTPTSLNNVVMLKHFGEGGLVTSDFIEKDKLIYAKAIKAASARKKLQQAVLKVATGASVQVGQDYVVDIVVQNYIAMGDESTLVKVAAAKATSNSASDLFVALAKSIVRNFSRDINKFFKIYLTTESSSHGTDNTKWTEVTDPKNQTLSGTYTGIIISEQSQEADYVRGESPVRTVNFKVFPKTVIDANGLDVQTFDVDNNTGAVVNVDKVAASASDVTYIKNGYELADTEYFCHGERGDQLRMAGYPNIIRTKYMVDPTKEYDVIDIAWYFQGRGVQNQHSDKHVTIVVEDNTKAKAIASALDTLLSTSLATELA